MMKRTTIYFDDALHRALRLKAIESHHSVSELISDAVRLSLAEDADDVEAYNARKRETRVSFEDALKHLKKNGKI